MIVLDFTLTPCCPPPRREPGRALQQATGGLHRTRVVDVEPPADEVVELVRDRLRGWRS